MIRQTAIPGNFGFSLLFGTIVDGIVNIAIRGGGETGKEEGV